MTKKEKEKQKVRILTEFYNSGQIQQQAKGACYRNWIKEDSLIWEDVTNQTFMYLSAKNPELIIDLASRPDELLKYACRIMIWKCFSKRKDSKGNNNPKHSLVQNMLFTSSFSKRKDENQMEHGETEYEYEREGREYEFSDFKSHQVEDMVGPFAESNANDDMWETIRDELTPDEIEYLDLWLESDKRGWYKKKELNEDFTNLFKRIREIITKHKFKR